jgi:hypothetical protein
MGFFPPAISASTIKPNKAALRSKWKRIVLVSLRAGSTTFDRKQSQTCRTYGEDADGVAIKPQRKSVKLPASHVPAPRVSPMVANRTTAINRPLEQIWNMVRRYWGAYTSSQLSWRQSRLGLRTSTMMIRMSNTTEIEIGKKLADGCLDDGYVFRVGVLKSGICVMHQT